MGHGPRERPSSSVRRRRVALDDEPENHERWLVTYADLLTVLMALFIVMFAISVADTAKFEALKRGLPGNMGGSGSLLQDGAVHMEERPAQASSLAAPAAAALLAAGAQAELAREQAQALDAARKQLEAALRARRLESKVRFSSDERGLVMTVVTDDVLFALGSAELGADGRAVLDAVASVLTRLPHMVTVEGHTDDLPLSGRGRFATNWELSANRATSVLRHLVEAGGVPQSRVSAYGYAEQRPLVPNSPAQRSQNRRAEVVLCPTI